MHNQIILHVVGPYAIIPYASESTRLKEILMYIMCEGIETRLRYDLGDNCHPVMACPEVWYSNNERFNNKVTSTHGINVKTNDFLLRIQTPLKCYLMQRVPKHVHLCIVHVAYV